MRTKDEILTASMNDITNDKYKPEAHLWLEYRKIEVLIDIRDILEKGKPAIFGIYDCLSNN